jgi:hypothetical protein
MGLFDRFKKKESHYDSTNIRVHDLDVGFIFDYDLSTWEVKALYEYDWGDNFFTREYKIFNGSETIFLSIEEDDELLISVSNKMKVRQLGESLFDNLMAYQKVPPKITFEGREYFLEKESPGYFRDVASGDDNWTEFISWDYEDKEGEYLICIEQWGEKEFEASNGKYIDEFEISNILPAEDKK